MKPETLAKDPIFKEVFTEAELAKLSPSARKLYEEELKYDRDWYATVSEAQERALKKGRKEGRKEGRIEGKMEGKEIVLKVFKLWQSGRSVEEIAQACELNQAEILYILKELGLV